MYLQEDRLASLLKYNKSYKRNNNSALTTTPINKHILGDEIYIKFF